MSSAVPVPDAAAIEKAKAELAAAPKCPKCGAVLCRRVGSHGPFIGCTSYPACKYTEHIPTMEWTRKFQRERRDEGAGPSIINRSLQALRRGLNILREDGKLAVVPKIRLLKEPSARQGFIEPAKFEELLAALPSYLRPLVATLYYTGARRGEALLVEWEQVDLRRREITLRDSQTKTSEPRVLPLPSRVLALLQDIEPKRGKVFDATNLRVEWERAVVAVGLGTREKIDGGEGKHDWYRFRGFAAARSSSVGGSESD